MASKVILYRDLIRFQLHDGQGRIFVKSCCAMLRYRCPGGGVGGRKRSMERTEFGVASAAKYIESSDSPDMHGPETVSGPAKESERILALDTLRGVAALGILAMNIQYFSQVTAAYSNPTLTGSFTGFDFWLWLLARVFFDEKMMAIFSMLYGAGIVLLTSRIETRGAQSLPIFLRRSFWLLIFGLLHAYLLWSGDILFSYAVCGVLVYPFRKWPARRLLVMGVLLFSVSSVIYFGYGWSMKSWTPGKIQVIEQQVWRPSPQQIATQVAAYRGSWLSQVSQRIPEAKLLQVQALLYLTLWRAGSLMLVGMALYKLRLLTGDLKISTYWKLGVIGFTIGVPVILYGAYRDIAENWDFRYAFFIGSQFNYWGSLGVALGWISSCDDCMQNPATENLVPAVCRGWQEYVGSLCGVGPRASAGEREEDRVRQISHRQTSGRSGGSSATARAQGVEGGRR